MLKCQARNLHLNIYLAFPSSNMLHVERFYDFNLSKPDDKCMPFFGICNIKKVRSFQDNAYQQKCNSQKSFSTVKIINLHLL